MLLGHDFGPKRLSVYQETEVPTTNDMSFHKLAPKVIPSNLCQIKLYYKSRNQSRDSRIFRDELNFNIA